MGKKSTRPVEIDRTAPHRNDVTFSEKYLHKALQQKQQEHASVSRFYVRDFFTVCAGHGDEGMQPLRTEWVESHDKVHRSLKTSSQISGSFSRSFSPLSHEYLGTIFCCFAPVQPTKISNGTKILATTRCRQFSKNYMRSFSFITT